VNRRPKSKVATLMMLIALVAAALLLKWPGWY